MRITDTTYDHRGRATAIYEPEDVKVENDYDNLLRITETRRYDDSGGSPVLMAKTATYYDSWGSVYETRTYGITGGSGTDYTKVETWHDGRGLAIKTLSQGKVLRKTQYDGAGRVVCRATGYDTDETAYADADDLTGDTVLEELRYDLDATGAAELVGVYRRNHDAMGTGSLTVGSSGTARAQYTATWSDELHRSTCTASYGTNGGTDLTSRPSGTPPTSNVLLQETTYTIKSQVEDVTDPEGIVRCTQYTDWGATSKSFDNFVDGTPGPASDEDRTVELTYTSSGQLHKTTLKATGSDQVTENVMGVTRGTSAGDSRIASNDLPGKVKNPADVGDTDEVEVAYNAQGEVICRLDSSGTEHVYEYDARGRLVHDRATTLGTGVDGAVRRISTTYDALDRPVAVTSYDSATVGSGSVVNEVEYEYDKFGVVKTVYQEPEGAVNTGTSPKVTHAYSFPTDGTTGLRPTSTTYPDGEVITAVYNSGTDDTVSRVSGRKNGTDWVFEDQYLGAGQLVEREYGGLDVKRTLVGTSTENNDDYVGLDRYARTSELTVTDGTTDINSFQYSYNDRSQITEREALGSGEEAYFSEAYSYDDLGRVTDRQRGKDLGGGGEVIRDHECFTMDRSGNVTEYSDTTTSSCAGAVEIDHNTSNEITEVDSVAYDYSDSGELTDRGTNTDQTFDAWGRLTEVKVDSSVIASYEYNGLGQKTTRADSPALDDVNYFYSAGNQLLEEAKVSDGSKVKTLVWGTQGPSDIVQTIGAAANSEEYQLQDAKGNVTTRLDDSGAVAARHVYTAYGDPSQVSADFETFETIDEDLQLFAGLRLEVDSGLYSLGGRPLDPELASLTTRGASGSSSAGENPYLVAEDDPVNGIEDLVVAAPWDIRIQGGSGMPIEFHFAAFIHGDRGIWLDEPASVGWEFRTDNRDFGDPYRGSSRVWSEGQINSCAIGSAPTGSNFVGESVARRTSNPRHEVRDTASLTTNIASGSGSGCQSKIRFVAEAAYPLMKWIPTPSIDYDVTFTITAGPDTVTVSLEGSHNNFPDYEGYVDKPVREWLYKYHSPHAGPTPENLTFSTTIGQESRIVRGPGQRVGVPLPKRVPSGMLAWKSVVFNAPTPKRCGGTCP